jgi:hypothetical protein
MAGLAAAVWLPYRHVLMIVDTENAPVPEPLDTPLMNTWPVRGPPSRTTAKWNQVFAVIPADAVVTVTLPNLTLSSPDVCTST